MSQINANVDRRSAVLPVPTPVERSSSEEQRDRDDSQLGDSKNPDRQAQNADGVDRSVDVLVSSHMPIFAQFSLGYHPRAGRRSLLVPTSFCVWLRDEVGDHRFESGL